MAYYTDNLDKYGTSLKLDTNAAKIDTLIPYMNAGANATNKGEFTGYEFVDSSDGNAWFVGCSVPDTRIAAKLAGRKDTLQLLNTNAVSETATYTASDSKVYVLVMNFSPTTSTGGNSGGNSGGGSGGGSGNS